MDLLQIVASAGGVGGVMALLMFWSYKYLVAQAQQDRKFMEDRLTAILKDYNEASYSHTEAMLKHTQVLTELIILLRAKNGHK